MRFSGPGDEWRDFLDVLRVRRPPVGDGGFEHGHSTDLQQQEPHDGRTHKGPQWAARRDPHDANTEPQDCISKIVWMSAVAPQSAVHDLALVFRIGFELGELMIRQRFNENSGKGNDGSHTIPNIQARLTVGSSKDRKRHDDLESTLEKKYFIQAHPPEVGRVAPHGLVSSVLSVPQISACPERGQSQAPRCHDHSHQRESKRRINGGNPSGPCDDGESRSPPDVRNAGVFHADADEPQKKHTGCDDARAQKNGVCIHEVFL